MKVLFVCLGNICRSPMAEALYKHHIKEMGLELILLTDSCGTGNWHKGEQPDIRMVKTSEKNGVELKHQARQITQQDFDNFDWLLVMDHQNYEDVIQLCPEKSSKVKLLTDFNKSFKGQIVQDPYFGEQIDFDEVFNMLNIITKDLAIQFSTI